MARSSFSIVAVTQCLRNELEMLDVKTTNILNESVQHFEHFSHCRQGSSLLSLCHDGEFSNSTLSLLLYRNFLFELI